MLNKLNKKGYGIYEIIIVLVLVLGIAWPIIKYVRTLLENMMPS